MSTGNYSTFYNLSKDKQKLILQTAIVEFSKQGYVKASCNRIVKRAGISKGSLFQYFGSKEGLYVFVCERFIRKVKDIVKDSEPANLGFFDLIRGVLAVGIRFIDRYPEYFQIYLKIMFEQDVPGRLEFLQRVRLFSVEYFGGACRDAVRHGLIRSDISMEMILFTIDATLDKFFLAYAGEGSSGLTVQGVPAAELTKKMDELVAVLEQGLAVKN